MTQDIKETSARLEQLKQLVTATWDGNLVSKTDRDWLVNNGLAIRSQGYNVITEAGIKTLVDLKLLRP